jgi:hypothetical protein
LLNFLFRSIDKPIAIETQTQKQIDTIPNTMFDLANVGGAKNALTILSMSKIKFIGKLKSP